MDDQEKREFAELRSRLPKHPALSSQTLVPAGALLIAVAAVWQIAGDFKNLPSTVAGIRTDVTQLRTQANNLATKVDRLSRSIERMSSQGWTASEQRIWCYKTERKNQEIQWECVDPTEVTRTPQL